MKVDMILGKKSRVGVDFQDQTIYVRTSFKVAKHTQFGKSVFLTMFTNID